MKNGLERYFNSRKIQDELKGKYIVRYENFKREFEKENLSLIGLEKDSFSKMILPIFLEDLGYDYSANYILKELEKNKVDSYFKIGSILKDIGGIKDFEVEEINPFEKIKEIVFEKELGYFEEFEIVFKFKNCPIKIDYSSFLLKEYIKIEVLNDFYESKVKIKFNVPRYEEVNRYENIIVHLGCITKSYSFILRSENYHLLEGFVENEGVILDTRLDISILSKIKEVKNSVGVLEIIKIYENETKVEIPLNIIVKILKYVFLIEDFDIRFAIFCEDLFLKKPLALNELLNYLKKMYKKGILTYKSKEIIKYMDLLLDDSISSKTILLKLKEENGQIDSRFIAEVKNIYDFIEDKRILDKTINKIVNSKGIIYDENLIIIVYEFYKRTGDINSLNILLKEAKKIKFNIEKLSLNIEDIIKIIEFYKNNKDKFNYASLDIITSYTNKSKYIEKEFIYLLKDILKEKDDCEIKFLIENYNELFEKLIFYDKNIYLKYIEVNLNSEKDIKINLLENALDKFSLSKYNYLKIKIIKKFVRYYISIGDENKYIEYLNLYLRKFYGYENYKFIFEIIEENKDDISFLSILVTRFKFEQNDIMLKILSLVKDIFIKNERYDLLLIIINKLKGFERYYDTYNLLKLYVKNVDYIGENIYLTTIKVIFDNLDKNRKEEIFNLLNKREDFPIDFRVKCLNLFKNKDNEKKIIDSFLDGKIIVPKAKELALKEIYDDNYKFLNYIQTGANNEEIRNLVFKKCTEEFSDNKEYVKRLILDFGEITSKINSVKKYLKEYYKYKNNLALKYIFGDYIVSARYKGELCDRVILKGIFENKISTGIIFKDDIFKLFIERYLEKNNIDYIFLEECLIINNSLSNSKIEISDFIYSVIKFNKELFLNEYILIDFSEEAFENDKKYILPNKFEKIINYRENRKISKNNSPFHKDGNILNEKNIIIYFKRYLYLLILKLKDNFKYNKEIVNYFLVIIKNDKIDNFKKLENSVEILVNKNKCKLDYEEMIINYESLDIHRKKLLINEIIEKNDLREKSVNIVLEDEYSNFEKDEYLNYLIKYLKTLDKENSVEKILFVYRKIITSIKGNRRLIRKYKYDLLEKINEIEGLMEESKKEIYKQLYFNNIINIDELESLDQ